MIYVIVNNSNTCCKIGYSKNPNKRLIELQTGNPEKLSLLRTYNGFIALEKHIYLRYKHLKIHNEWFIYSNNLLKDLDENFSNIKIEEEHEYSISGYKVTKEEFESLKPGVKISNLSENLQQILKFNNKD
jgi:hypothetical protein